MSVVVDASVACKWFLSEDRSDAAQDVLLEDELIVPELLYAEVGNVLWKRVRSHDLTEDDAVKVLAKLVSLPLVIADSRPLAASALRIASAYDRSFYDSLYVALAVARNTVLVTADRRTVNSLAGTHLAVHVRLL